VRDTRLAWCLNPYFQLGVSAVMLSAAEISLKIGATTGGGETAVAALFNFGAIASLSTWIGIFFYVLSFLIWLHVLRLMPLTEAYSLTNVVHITVPAAAWFFLHESISISRMIGIAFVLCGTLLVAAPSAKAEEKL
jgi:undecaprenyl phosphate-alpha-L-ara4N flippase subunit ArnF